MAGPERLAEWEVDLLTPEVGEGDLVRAGKGENVIQGRVDSADFVGDSGRTVRGLVADGYAVRVTEKAKPKLPTEPGFYTTGHVLYELDARGWVIFFGFAAPRRRTPEEMLAHANVERLVRLVPEAAS